MLCYSSMIKASKSLDTLEIFHTFPKFLIIALILSNCFRKMARSIMQLRAAWKKKL